MNAKYGWLLGGCILQIIGCNRADVTSVQLVNEHDLPSCRELVERLPKNDVFGRAIDRESIKRIVILEQCLTCSNLPGQVLKGSDDNKANLVLAGDSASNIQRLVSRSSKKDSRGRVPTSQLPLLVADSNHSVLTASEYTLAPLSCETSTQATSKPKRLYTPFSWEKI